MRQMKLIHVGMYRTYGFAYSDHVRNNLGGQVVTFSICKAPRVKFPSKGDVVLGEMRAVAKILLHLPLFRHSAVYSTGAGYALMLVSRVFGWALGKESRLYLHNFYLHGLGNNRCVQRILRFLMNNDRLTLIAQTPNEEQFYRKLSSRMDIKFVPYCSDVESRENRIGLREGYIFTGGYTNRDYPLMLKLARQMPARTFVFVVSKLNGDMGDVPPNVVVKRDIEAQEFSNLMAKASLVVVPLKADVGSSGQMLCIQAMRYHKPIVYADASSINYYFPRESALPYRIGSLPSLAKAVEQVYADEEKAMEMGERAYKESLKYTVEKGWKMIDDIVLGGFGG